MHIIKSVQGPRSTSLFGFVRWYETGQLSDYTAPFVHKRVITACEDFLPSAAKKLLKRNFFEGKIKVNLLLDVPKLFH